jgi:hypothetical protein
MRRVLRRLLEALTGVSGVEIDLGGVVRTPPPRVDLVPRFDPARVFRPESSRDRVRRRRLRQDQRHVHLVVGFIDQFPTTDWASKTNRCGDARSTDARAIGPWRQVVVDDLCVDRDRRRCLCSSRARRWDAGELVVDRRDVGLHGQRPTRGARQRRAGPGSIAEDRARLRMGRIGRRRGRCAAAGEERWQHDSDDSDTTTHNCTVSPVLGSEFAIDRSACLGHLVRRHPLPWTRIPPGTRFGLLVG